MENLAGPLIVTVLLVVVIPFLAMVRLIIKAGDWCDANARLSRQKAEGQLIDNEHQRRLQGLK